MILHFILNSLFVFLILSLLIESFFYLFRIKNARVRYFCRFLPILKLPFDFSVFLFYGESVLINLNPFSCEIYVHELLTQLFGIKEISSVQEHLVIPQYIAKQIPSFWLHSLTCVVIVITTVGILRKCIQFLSSKI